MASAPVPPLGIISLPPAPKRHSDPKVYQDNVEKWARDAEKTVRTFEATIRAIITKVNGP